jgi:beta-glucosidase
MKYRFFNAFVIAVVLLHFSCSTQKREEKSSVATVVTLTEEDRREIMIDSLIRLMTLEEKIAMIHASSSFTSGGVPRLGIPELVMSDGPHGVRKEHGRDWKPDLKGDDSSTYLPTGITLAATWNPELGYAHGKVLGEEAKFRGKDIILGPGVNIMRTPLNGRNFEYLSEDPFLASAMATGYIKGVQDQGIAACVKHYLANNQEKNRDKINVVMSERALREIYLPAFAAAVKEGKVYSVMGAYNKFRGQFCTHNKYLVNDILKGELQFDGVMMSDWGAVHNTIEAANNGCDLEMGSEFTVSTADKPDYSRFYMADTLIKLVKNGTINESVIDEKVRRILRLMFRTNVTGKNKRTPGAINTPEHQKTALKIAQEAITLLKNEQQILPLKKDSIKTIAVIGANADHKHAGAGGSSQVNAKYEITALSGIRNIAGNGITVKYAPGYVIAKDKKPDPKLIREALATVKDADAVIYVGGWIHGYTDEWNDNAMDAEAVDKADMKLPFGQNELISALLKANPGTVIVLYGGGPSDLSAFADKAKAIVQAYYPGMEGGNALAQILFGEINPSGKLPVSWPVKLQDVPAHALGEYPGNDTTVVYKDDIWVGYRYYDTRNVATLFPFGHGLSYSSFEFSNLKIDKKDQSVTVKITVRNTGEMAGAEVVQIYVKDQEASVERPEKELKGFSKVYLQPWESKDVVITLNEDAFKYYDEVKKLWILEPGKFTISAGSSSQNIKVQKEISF